jgi:RimJ/RimL family protein N-acetyltransferase
MARCDLQFGNIWTSDNYKNQGIASYSLEHLLQLYCDKKVWFLCNVNNEASIKLALRSGFELVGRGYKNSRFINIFSKYILIK